MSSSRSPFVVPLLAAALAAGLCAQDMIQLKDGRFVQTAGVKMTRTPEGVKVHFKNGDVMVKKDLVLEAAVSKTEGMAEEKPPADAAEKEAAGFVRFEGKWLKKEQRDKLLDDRQRARAKKIKEAMDHRDWKARYKKSTANFDFEYTIDPEVMGDFSAMMEEYYKRFLGEWKIAKPADMGKLKVCFYHDQDLYYQVSGAPRGAIGYFRFVKPIELNFYFDRNDRDLTFLVMFHETNHYLTHLIAPDFYYPIWINESLAEYYGASKWDPVKKQMAVGFLQEGRLTSIQDDILNSKWQDLDALMHLDQSGFGADKYAWGWSFVHYLLENKKYAQKFKAFYVGLARDKAVKKVPFQGSMKTVPPDETIKYLLQTLGVKDLKTLEKEWHEYVKGLKPTSGRGFAEAAEMYSMYGMPLKAKRFYETAIEKGDKRAVVYHGLGRVLEQKGEHEAAEAAYRSAVECDPLNGVYYAALASAVSRKTKDPKNEETKRLRLLALEVDPDNSELIQLLSIEAAADEALRKALGGDKGGPESKPE
jgi:tetratricopeptide (TPR) repeat protein